MCCFSIHARQTLFFSYYAEGCLALAIWNGTPSLRLHAALSTHPHLSNAQDPPLGKRGALDRNTYYVVAAADRCRYGLHSPFFAWVPIGPTPWADWYWDPSARSTMYLPTAFNEACFDGDECSYRQLSAYITIDSKGSNCHTSTEYHDAKARDVIDEQQVEAVQVGPSSTSTGTGASECVRRT